jgi:hypothetical protein
MLAACRRGPAGFWAAPCGSRAAGASPCRASQQPPESSDRALRALDQLLASPGALQQSTTSISSMDSPTASMEDGAPGPGPSSLLAAAQAAQAATQAPPRRLSRSRAKRLPDGLPRVGARRALRRGPAAWLAQPGAPG